MGSEVEVEVDGEEGEEVCDKGSEERASGDEGDVEEDVEEGVLDGRDVELDVAPVVLVGVGRSKSTFFGALFEPVEVDGIARGSVEELPEVKVGFDSEDGPGVEYSRIHPAFTLGL